MDSPKAEIRFDDVVRGEIEAINERRSELGRSPLPELHGSIHSRVPEATGLALSGGGIRSAAFSLGVLQALNHHGALRNIDYLSTVSGGGYAGCALSATMTSTNGEFVFGDAQSADVMTPPDISDTPAVGHLRDYSNYLNPGGAYGLLASLAVVMRGIIANLGLVLSIVLVLAAYTIFIYPDRSLLGCPDLIAVNFCYYIPLRSFAMTFVVIAVGLVVFYFWALYRSFLPSRKLAEFRGRLSVSAALYLIAVAVIFFVDLQALLLSGMFDVLGDVQKDAARYDWLANLLITIAVAAIPVAVAFMWFRSVSPPGGLGGKLGKIGNLAAAACLPLLAWLLYLYLSFWGIVNDRATGLLRIDQVMHEIRGVRWSDFEKLDPYDCSELVAISGTRAEQRAREPQGAGRYGTHTPEWLIETASSVTYSVACPIARPIAGLIAPTRPIFRRLMDRPVIALYTLLGMLLLFTTQLLRANANSLHYLYRARLSKAFLFDPTKREPPDKMDRGAVRPEAERDFVSLDGMRMSQISCRHAPYHLINTALNIQGSAYANRRGRNADFFFISPRFIGSSATGYADMAEFEKAADDLDVAAAMAISGAAASSNMGANSIDVLRPTLALLNVRLGYWLKNPRGVTAAAARRWRLSLGWTRFLRSEIAGRLHEAGPEVYLTDGGHIENLGIYELLRRRCRLIVAVDAEADHALRFPSFIVLQRYARIDLGIRIDMPHDKIRKTTEVWMGALDDQLPPAAGPHAAIAEIDYGAGRTGFILYFKSSLTGDENDYLRDYARRVPLFPHEPTGNQFFGEEQFEVYRALGFHIAHGVLSGRDELCVAGATAPCTFKSKDDKAVTTVREFLLGAERTLAL